MIISKEGNTTFDLETGELKMVNAEITTVK